MDKTPPVTPKMAKQFHVVLKDGKTYVFHIKEDITAYESAMYFELMFMGAVGQGHFDPSENEERLKVLERHLVPMEED